MFLLNRIEQDPQVQVVQQSVATPQTEFIDRAVNVLLVSQRQVPTIYNTVEIPQAHFIPVVIHDRCLCKRSWSSHRSSTL